MDRSPRIAETHVSTLFFVDDRVFKRKKPVTTGFLDFSTEAARGEACRREVELNRRLAPDVYLGVADVAMAGEPLDHLVVMRRLPEERRLSARLDAATIKDDLGRLAHLMATFHAATQRSAEIDVASGALAVADLWDRGLDQISGYAGSVLRVDDVERTELLARAYLAGRRPLLDQRVAEGHACDGHGDLQAEDIFLLDDGPRVLDCLEFDDALRWGDTLLDVAFLAMDLERLGHPALGARFLERYAELSGDRWPSSLAHLHISYRAHVRAKVACLRHDQGDPEAAAAARSLQCIALGHLEAGRVGLTVVGGSPGTGKSALSRELADRLGAVRVSSDEVRDDVFPRESGGVDAFGAGRYTPERVGAVYDVMLRRAELLLSHGERVVLDASWLDPEHRAAAAALAERTSSFFTQLRCECPPDLVAERIRTRRADGGDASEATSEVATRMAETNAPWPDATAIDTAVPLGDAVGLAEAIATRR